MGSTEVYNQESAKCMLNERRPAHAIAEFSAAQSSLYLDSPRIFKFHAACSNIVLVGYFGSDPSSELSLILLKALRRTGILRPVAVVANMDPLLSVLL